MHHFELEKEVCELKLRIGILEQEVFGPPAPPLKVAPPAPASLSEMSMGQEFDQRTERPATDDDPL